MKVGDRIRDALYKRGLGTITELIPLNHPKPGTGQYFRYCAMVSWDNPQPEFCRQYDDPCVSEEYLEDTEGER
jgi:hypothetical protein